MELKKALEKARTNAVGSPVRRKLIGLAEGILYFVEDLALKARYEEFDKD